LLLSSQRFKIGYHNPVYHNAQTLLNCAHPAGGVRQQRGHVNITGSIMEHNYAHRHGGAMYVGTMGANKTDRLANIHACYNLSHIQQPALWLSGCNVTNNTAEASGGEPDAAARQHPEISFCSFVEAIQLSMIEYFRIIYTFGSTQ
jgi:hypothetical protein